MKTRKDKSKKNPSQIEITTHMSSDEAESAFTSDDENLTRIRFATDKEEPSVQDEEMVSFVEGASVIDMGELRRAQANIDAFLDDEKDDDNELSLDAEAALIRKEIDSDPELKKDVLSNFNRFESNEDLERIASKVTEQEIKQLHEMEILAGEVSEELMTLNQVFIAEDKLLESTIARDLAIEAADAHNEDIETEEMSEEDAALKAALPHADENGEYNLDDLQSCVEALLFYSDRPTSLKKLKEMLEMTEADDAPILLAIEKLKAAYQTHAHGFEVAEIANGYQLRTKPSKSALLRKLAKIQVQRLSRGAMETLTICAYKQPCTKDEIDQVRGVDSSHFIRTLLDRKLIEVSGRSEAAGRPMIYNTTDTFLEVFGLMNLQGLPPLREIEAMVPQMVASEEGAEDPRVIQMRKMVHQMKIESNHLDYNPREDERILQEIRERVKSIDISTPYLARQKELAGQGIQGEEAELLLAKEFGFDRASSGGEPIHLASETQSELPLHEESTDHQALEDEGQESTDQDLQ
ncbi:MAG: SMC-Scp complex subunit ScpB [Bdellovibrionales bacterium]|nr:SMC-Scp complex subunit ScpB [Oligoflexia bacterium]